MTHDEGSEDSDALRFLGSLIHHSGRNMEMFIQFDFMRRMVVCMEQLTFQISCVYCKGFIFY